MESKEIRLNNLLALATGYKRNAEFCKRIGMNPTYFSQLKTGRKTVGDELARRIEATLGLPRGYLDTQKTETPPSHGQIPVETMGIAYALEALSPAIRETLSRLIYTLAAEAAEHKTRREQVVAPFAITIGGKFDETGDTVRKEATG